MLPTRSRPTAADLVVETADNALLPDAPTVSVVMATFNHEAYIGKAIEGVLRQAAPFPFELLVGDDCSTDRTGDIVRDFQRRYPAVVRLISYRRNVGMQRNIAHLLDATKGRFIAWCEGDDVWLSPDKLARQVEALERDAAAALCFHDVLEIDDNGATVTPSKLTKVMKVAPPPRLTSRETALGVLIPTCAALHRRLPLPPVRLWEHIVNVDTFVFAHVCRHGDAVRIDGVHAAHRLHPGGVWSTKSRIAKNMCTLESRLALVRTLGAPNDLAACEAGLRLTRVMCLMVGRRFLVRYFVPCAKYAVVYPALWLRLATMRAFGKFGWRRTVEAARS